VRRKPICTVLLITMMSLVPISGAPAEPDTGISLTVMASKISWTDAQYVGHAFLCIALRLNSGIKEDCLGFYPADNKIKSFIGGQGVVDSEFSSKRPSHFGNVTVSVQKDLTEDQRRAIYSAADEYNSMHYNLTDSNCIDFVDKVAQIVGWKRPLRSSIQFPVDYVTKLKELNP
jgi:hypothetical protein